MGYLYQDLHDLKESLPFLHKIHELPESLMLFIISDSIKQREKGCLFTKSVLEEVLKNAQTHKQVTNFEIEIFDLTKKENHKLIDLVYQIRDFYEKMGKTEKGIYIPIFHNVDNFPDFPQILFDSNKPAIFSISREGYHQVYNTSKRDCFEKIYLDNQ